MQNSLISVVKFFNFKILTKFFRLQFSKSLIKFRLYKKNYVRLVKKKINEKLKFVDLKNMKLV